MRTAQLTLLTAAALARVASAGTVCMAYSFKALGPDTTDAGKWDLFPIQGNPCESDAHELVEFTGASQGDSLCSVLPREFTVCGVVGTLVATEDGGSFPEGNGGESECGVVLSVDHVEYGGRVFRNGEGDCSGSCGGAIATQFTGSVVWEDVPLCAPAGMCSPLRVLFSASL